MINHILEQEGNQTISTCLPYEPPTKKMATLNVPSGVFVSNGEVFIADTANDRVRKVLRNGQIVTIAGTGSRGYNGDGQLATDAELWCPYAVFVSSSDQVYISEKYGHRIRKIDRNGIISTIAGTGKNGYNGDDQLAVNALLNYPCGLFVTDDEQVLFVDNYYHRVRKIDRNGIISTVTGNGNVLNEDGSTSLDPPIMFCPTSVFQYKNEIYIADDSDRRIGKIDRNGITDSGSRITKIDRNGITSTVARIITTNPVSIFIHNDEVYFTTDAHSLCKVLPNGIIKTIAGIENENGFNGHDMLATQCKLNLPRGIFVDMDSQIYIADSLNHCIRRIDQNGMVRNVVGTGKKGYSGDVPFDFKQYPHIGTRRKSKIKPFPQAYHDLIVICVEMDSFQYEPVTKKIKTQKMESHMNHRF